MTKSVSIDGKDYGSEQLFLISGPCVIEDKKIMFETAEQLKIVSEKLDIPVIYKSSFMKDNRSSVEYYVGPGIEEGLNLLQKIRGEFGNLNPLQAPKIYHRMPGNADLVYQCLCNVLSERENDWQEFGLDEWNL